MSRYWIGKTRSAYLENPRAVALLASLAAFFAVMTLEHSIRFTDAFRSLYILPIWIATRLGGRWIGFLIVGLTVVLDGFLQALGPQHSGSQILIDGSVRLVCLSGIMLLFAHLEGSLARYQYHALRDPLTGLLNRRALRELGEPAHANAVASGASFVVAVLDCDRFKQLNDQHGHAMGDRALKVLAQVLQRRTRMNDLVVRLGGDEFLLILPNTGEVEAVEVLTRIDFQFTAIAKRHGWDSSLSFGHATATEDHESLDHLIHLADDRMYKRKATKQQVYFA